MNEKDIHPILNFLYIRSPELSDEIICKTKNDPRIVLFIDTLNKHGLAEQRSIFIKLMNSGNNVPVIISRCYHDLSLDNIQINASVDIGGLFVDGLGDGLFIYIGNEVNLYLAHVCLFRKTKARVLCIM